MHPFWNAAERRLRAPWRLLLQAAMAVAFAAVAILGVAEPLAALHRAGLLLPDLGKESFDRVVNLVVGPFLVLAVIASVAIACRRLDRRPLSDLGLRRGRNAWRGLALGFGLGAALMLLVFAIELAAGWITITGWVAATVPDLSLGLAFGFTVTKVACVATYEELVARGYWLRNLIDGLGRPAGIALASAAFALLHLTTENPTPLAMAGLFCVGLLFSAAVLTTGSLATAIGLHAAWNLFEGAVLGFPVSGDREGASLIAIAQCGPVFATGGDYGPEGGLVGIGAALLGIAILRLRGGSTASDARRKEPGATGRS